MTPWQKLPRQAEFSNPNIPNPPVRCWCVLVGLLSQPASLLTQRHLPTIRTLKVALKEQVSGTTAASAVRLGCKRPDLWGENPPEKTRPKFLGLVLARSLRLPYPSTPPSLHLTDRLLGTKLGTNGLGVEDYSPPTVGLPIPDSSASGPSGWPDLAHPVCSVRCVAVGAEKFWALPCPTRHPRRVTQTRTRN